MGTGQGNQRLVRLGLVQVDVCQQVSQSYEVGLIGCWVSRVDSTLIFDSMVNCPVPDVPLVDLGRMTCQTFYVACTEKSLDSRSMSCITP